MGREVRGTRNKEVPDQGEEGGVLTAPLLQAPSSLWSTRAEYQEFSTRLSFLNFKLDSENHFIIQTNLS